MFFSAKLEQERIDSEDIATVLGGLDLGIESQTTENPVFLNTPNICDRRTLRRTLK